MDVVVRHAQQTPTAEPCAVCKDLDRNKLEYKRVPRWDLPSNCLDIDWIPLEASSLECMSCALLVAILDKFTAVTNRVDMYIIFHRTIFLCVGEDPRMELVLYSSKTTPWNNITNQGHLSGWTGSEESLEFAKNSLVRCQRDHEVCRTPKDTLLPTRVLDLGPCESSDTLETVKVYETNHSQAPYACLSHCWGTSHRLMTTADNIHAHKQGISIASLPKTFRDAVHFTRRLGIRYLWIDSL